MKNTKNNTISTITVLSIFILGFILVIIRWINIFNKNIYVISNEINSHITNFTLSLMLCTLIGYLLIYYKKKYLSIIILGLIIICINIIYETLLPFLNAIDFIDAIYGIVGVIISMLSLLFIYKQIGYNKKG